MALLWVLLLQAVLPSFADGGVDDFARASLDSEIAPSADINKGFDTLKASFHRESVYYEEKLMKAKILEALAKSLEGNYTKALAELEEKQVAESQVLSQLAKKEESMEAEIAAKQEEIEAKRLEAVRNLNVKSVDAANAQTAFAAAMAQHELDAQAYTTVNGEKTAEMARLAAEITEGMAVVATQQGLLQIAQEENQQLLLAQIAQEKLRNQTIKPQLQRFSDAFAQAERVRKEAEAALTRAEKALEVARKEYSGKPYADEAAQKLVEIANAEQQLAKEELGGIKAVMIQAEDWKDTATEFYKKLTAAETSLKKLSRKVKLQDYLDAWGANSRNAMWEKIGKKPADRTKAQTEATALLDALEQLNLKSATLIGIVSKAGIKLKNGNEISIEAFDVMKDENVKKALVPHCSVHFLAQNPNQQHAVCS